MDEQHETAGNQRGSLATAGAGVVGGASVAAGIFGTLGLAKILANADGSYAPGYPLVVFGMVALFILISALAVAPLSSDGAKFARIGVWGFLGITIVGSVIFYLQSYKSPTTYVTATFSPEPSSFEDANNEKKLQLILQYSTANGKGVFVPWDRSIPLSGRDVVNLKLVGLEKLENNYNEGYRANQTFHRQLKLACQGQQSNICSMVNADMSTDQ